MPAPTSRPYAARAAASAAYLLVACSALLGLTAAPAAAAPHKVVIEQYSYSPADLTIDQGDTVTWTNQDSVQHDVMVTAGAATFHSPLLTKGQSWSHRFDVAGSYSYTCSIHPDMVAAISVHAHSTPRPTASKAPAAAPPAPVSSAPAPAPAPEAGATTAAPAPQVAAPEAALPATEVTSTQSLDPLLLVAGASTAVTVFCLLLLSSRPARAVVPAADE